MKNAASSLVWLITGASRGIGRVIAETVLSQGGHVAAAARKLRDLQDLAAAWPQTCLAVSMDMNVPTSLQSGLDAVMARFGRVDVLVNNAGYGLQGMAEEVSMEQVRAQMETNFFGLVDLTQRVLPHMRAQGSGYIMNVSSVAGLRGSAGLSIYNASKYAVNGFSEALAQEVRQFGIRVSIVEPGPYRTDWAGSSLQRAETVHSLDTASPYAEDNARMKRAFDERSGKQPGDPKQIAQVLLGAVADPNPPVHMLFGDIAIDWWKEQHGRFLDTAFMRHFPHDQYIYA